MIWLFVCVGGAYLIGSIPTALIAGRILGAIDIRTTGSGNLGATNIYRAFGLGPYLAVLFLDMFKGFFATAYLPLILGADIVSAQRLALICGISAVLGHVFTIFARFKGGKGVATAGGMMIALAPNAVFVAVIVYLVVALTTQYVSLGSMLAAIFFCATLFVEKFYFGENITPELLTAGLLLAVMIVATHTANIKRLVAGNENRTDFLKKFRK